MTTTITDMSLKAFHILFIAVSILTCWGFSAWCFFSHVTAGQTAYKTAGVASILAGLGLIIYGTKFLKKLRELNIS